MTKYYLRNYKGFESTLISLDSVSFLVGENSTGKTSLLNVINLFSDVNFWYSHDAPFDETIFGSFEDLKTRNSASDSFSLGYFTQPDSESLAKATGIIIKFRNRDGSPSPRDIFIVGNRSLVLFRLEQNRLYALTRHLAVGDCDDFESWCQAWVDRFETYKFKLKAFVRVEDDGFSGPLLAAQSHSRRVLKELNEPPFLFTRVVTKTKTIAPIRAKPRSVYLSTRGEFSPEGDHTPLLFKALHQDAGAKAVKAAIERFGSACGLFDKIEVSRFGLRNNSPFEIDIVKDGKRYNISSIGYGVSQIFPIIVELFTSSEETLFTIQQPEVHLHPRAQASFGELILELTMSRQLSFVVETHSDFLLDRFRLALRSSTAESPVQAKVLFFSQTAGRNTIKEIAIAKDGTLIGDGVEEFRTFFIEESLRMLEL